MLFRTLIWPDQVIHRRERDMERAARRNGLVAVAEIRKMWTQIGTL